MKKAVIIVFILLAICNRDKAQTHQPENFSSFFQHFSQNASFQKSRIKFPVKVIDVEDNASNSAKLITANKWVFYNIRQLKKDKNNLFKITYPSKDEAIVSRQVEDTGVSLKFTFKNFNGEWWLVLIVNESD